MGCALRRRIEANGDLMMLVRARGPVLTLVVGAWSAFGAVQGAGQAGPVEPVGAGGQVQVWDEQGDGGAGEQARAHRMGGGARGVPLGEGAWANVDESFERPEPFGPWGPATYGSGTTPPLNCEGTVMNDGTTSHTGVSKTWLIRRRENLDADRSIKDDTRATHQGQRDTTLVNRPDIRPQSCPCHHLPPPCMLAIREETIYGLAKRNPTSGARCSGCQVINISPFK